MSTFLPRYAQGLGSVSIDAGLKPGTHDVYHADMVVPQGARAEVTIDPAQSPVLTFRNKPPLRMRGAAAALNALGSDKANRVADALSDVFVGGGAVHGTRFVPDLGVGPGGLVPLGEGHYLNPRSIFERVFKPVSLASPEGTPERLPGVDLLGLDPTDLLDDVHVQVHSRADGERPGLTLRVDGKMQDGRFVLTEPLDLGAVRVPAGVSMPLGQASLLAEKDRLEAVLATALGQAMRLDGLTEGARLHITCDLNPGKTQVGRLRLKVAPGTTMTAGPVHLVRGTGGEIRLGPMDVTFTQPVDIKDKGRHLGPRHLRVDALHVDDTGTITPRGVLCAPRSKHGVSLEKGLHEAEKLRHGVSKVRHGIDRLVHGSRHAQAAKVEDPIGMRLNMDVKALLRGEPPLHVHLPTVHPEKYLVPAAELQAALGSLVQRCKVDLSFADGPPLFHSELAASTHPGNVPVSVEVPRAPVRLRCTLRPLGDGAWSLRARGKGELVAQAPHDVQRWQVKGKERGVVTLDSNGAPRTLDSSVRLNLQPDAHPARPIDAEAQVHWEPGGVRVDAGGTDHESVVMAMLRKQRDGEDPGAPTLALSVDSPFFKLP